MLVQLRRVVYLLVLLQCCLCVVHATGVAGPPPGVPSEEEQMRDLAALRPRAEGLSDSLESVQKMLTDTVKLSNEVLTKASDDVKNVKDLIPKEGAGTQNGETAGDGGESMDLKETVEKAQGAVAQAGLLVKDMNKYYDYAVDQREKGSDMAEKLNTTLKKYLELPEDKRTGDESVLEGAKASLQKLRKSLDELQGTINTTTADIEKMNTELKSLKETLGQIKGIQEPPLPQAPQTPGQQEGERTKEVATSRENAAEGGVTPQKGTEGMKEATESTEKPANAIPNQQNETQGDKNEEQSATEKANETLNAPSGAATGDSQKPNETSNTASGTVNTGSGGVTSGGSLHHNVSALSDGSSSPALVHSPLLLLLVCVLGSVLVF